MPSRRRASRANLIKLKLLRTPRHFSKRTPEKEVNPFTTFNMTFKKHDTRSFASLLALFLTLSSPTWGGVVFHATESLNHSGDKIVTIRMEEGGTIQLEGATYLNSAKPQASIEAPKGRLLTGPNAGVSDYYSLPAIDGPELDSETPSVAARYATGPRLGFNVLTSRLFVPKGYVSGEPLASSVTIWRNHTFKSLGLPRGTQVFRYSDGNGGTDTITLQVGPLAETPATVHIDTIDDGQLQLRWGSEAEAVYTVESSADGQDWQPVQSITGSEGETSTIVDRTGNMRLYRVRREG